jgi:hypothetical protein
MHQSSNQRYSNPKFHDKTSLQRLRLCDCERCLCRKCHRVHDCTTWSCRSPFARWQRVHSAYGNNRWNNKNFFLHLEQQITFLISFNSEGCLIASTNRGCSALRVHGVTSCLINDGMSRAPVIRFSSITRATEAKYWISDPENFQELKKEFDSTSRYLHKTITK